jgi:FAD/FMN-containing dehydrogenase
VHAASVGLAGGFGQAGGHGVFTPMYGLMVDQAVEFDVVTADGEARTINECNDPDLFWAMRGGGGGTYAVLIAYRFQLYAAKPIHMHTLKVSYSPITEALQNQKAVRSLLTAHVQNQTVWSANNVTGRHYYAPNEALMLTILPYNDDGTKLKSLTQKWRQGVLSIPGIHIEQDEYQSFSSYTQYDSVAQVSAAELTPNGFAPNTGSRLIPRHLFEGSANQSLLVDATLKGMAEVFSLTSLIRTQVSLEILMTTPANVPDARGETSAHPAWRDSLWHAIFLGGWMKGFPAQSQQQIVQNVNRAAQYFRDISPGSGSYANEDSILTPDWQRNMYGNHYERLLGIKERYDPTHMFDCWKCVGWRGEEE